MMHSLTLATTLSLVLGACAHKQSADAQPHHRVPDTQAHPAGALHRRFTDAEKWAKRFDSAKRAQWQKPDAVLAKLALQATSRVADIGAGTGYFAARIARKVPRGVVFAIDLEPTMVKYLEKRATKESLANLRAVLGTASDAKIPEPVDLVFLCNTYHHIGDRAAYFRAVATRIRLGGRLVIVDFKMGKIPVGPPEKHRVTPTQLHQELNAAGYDKVELDDKTLPVQYIAIYRPRAAAK